MAGSRLRRGRGGWRGRTGAGGEGRDRWGRQRRGHSRMTSPAAAPRFPWAPPRVYVVSSSSASSPSRAASEFDDGTSPNSSETAAAFLELKVGKWFSTHFEKPCQLVRFKEASKTRLTDPDYTQGYKIMFTDCFPFLVACQINNLAFQGVTQLLQGLPGEVLA